MTLIFAIITITLALVFYTWGVFSERKFGELKPVHLVLFALGLVFDVTGATLMAGLAEGSSGSGMQLHQITGLAAIILMAFYFIWAIFVIVKGSHEAKNNFHKFSLVVWLFWLIPYVVGVIIGMS